MSIKTYKTKKDFESFQKIFFLQCRGTWCDSRRNLTPIREYSSTVKNRRKCATVYYRVVVKGLT
jgi:hypothetical protein